MSGYYKKKRHGFLKFILVVLILAILGIGGAWFYVHYYPGGSVENLKNHVKKAQHMFERGASGVKETVKETLSGERDSGSLLPLLNSTEDINLRSGGDGYYYFTYNGEDFRAMYAANTWTIYDSFKITNKNDITIICQALSDVYPVPSRDWQSYRTADDMAYEWDQHNKIYLVAPKDSYTRERTRNVDLDPEDQGKTYEDLYRENLE